MAQILAPKDHQTSQKVVVVGGGLIGVTTAYYLRKEGHDVTVIEQGNAVGMETSFANGGIICPSLTKPWANPDMPKMLWHSLTSNDSPVKFNFSIFLMPQFWRWGPLYLMNCTPKSTERNTQRLFNLAKYSTKSYLELLRAHPEILQCDQTSRGSLQLYKADAAFTKAKKQAAILSSFGCPVSPLDPKAIVELEPTLKSQEELLVGAVFSEMDTNGDAHKFTTQLAQICQQDGVKFLFNTQVKSLKVDNDQVRAIQTADGEIQADYFVVAAGNHTPSLAKTIGVNVPIFPVKGYSITISVDDAHAPQVNVIDDASKIYVTRLGNSLRVSGCAELVGYDFSIDSSRTGVLLNGVKRLLNNDQLDGTTARYWTGLRPVAPDDVPFVGPSDKYKNLYLNCGHGSKGFTLSCGSAKMVADIIANRPSEVNIEDYATDRFSVRYAMRKLQAAIAGLPTPQVEPISVPFANRFTLSPSETVGTPIGPVASVAAVTSTSTLFVDFLLGVF
eukprot:GILJ01006032.1.p1 GENE.GILJ01006032.1~~GILJ01006032.1.p1  ORF type:complete len:503 (-),score=66.06 GILJ01006032.1:258-1766(-)